MTHTEEEGKYIRTIFDSIRKDGYNMCKREMSNRKISRGNLKEMNIYELCERRRNMMLDKKNTKYIINREFPYIIQSAVEDLLYSISEFVMNEELSKSGLEYIYRPMSLDSLCEFLEKNEFTEEEKEFIILDHKKYNEEKSRECIIDFS